jgi:hypothetical protein
MRAIKATDAYLVLFNIDNRIRGILKNEPSEETQIAVQGIRSEIYSSTIDLDDGPE